MMDLARVLRGTQFMMFTLQFDGPVYFVTTRAVDPDSHAFSLLDPDSGGKFVK